MHTSDCGLSVFVQVFENGTAFVFFFGFTFIGFRLLGTTSYCEYLELRNEELRVSFFGRFVFLFNTQISFS